MSAAQAEAREPGIVAVLGCRAIASLVPTIITLSFAQIAVSDAVKEPRAEPALRPRTEPA